ncbi:hypothetical protein PSHT_03213 [Puccinia striiformis]|uniref:Uncharacterized protein n=3 Tax=Puccinia striiformis TaxID=27350 RepID=A0A2S4UH99_9BASI|nr:hypothetical protein PSTG_05394 [Puccinia striiformis f. sp. tritici PST-78]POV96571.1 hypothetical protein PSHT_15071 [Puccinia striiformis]POW12043.1 hypothetical protein PSTT_04795 [Puccinia striiformis]POW20746.1 hypothetical protein PSHT_03213 [Puccinia striiformis]
MTGCGARSSEAIPSGWHWSASVHDPECEIFFRVCSGKPLHRLSRSDPAAGRRPPSNRGGTSLTTLLTPSKPPRCSSSMPASFLSLSYSRQGTLAAPTPISPQIDALTQALSLDKRYYGGYLTTTPWSTTANFNEYDAQNT